MIQRLSSGDAERGSKVHPAQTYLDKASLVLNPSTLIGQGGEAEVYSIGGGKVAKIFKQPNHPDFAHSAAMKAAVKTRIEEYQRKLPAFPGSLPKNVVTPQELISDGGGKRVLGYTMDFLKDMEVLKRYSDKMFRKGIPQRDVVELYRKLHETVVRVHRARVVIGDFNDLNVLVSGSDPYFIDADSYQFGQFLSRVFTDRFVDPMLCDTVGGLMLKAPHTESSDWYAFAVMLMESLLFVEPYGGIHKPKDPSKKLKPSERRGQRVTVFHSDVAYPKPAIPYSVLPDELLHEFQQMFERDKRGEFPLRLIESLQWTSCMTCGMEHARISCPHCFKPHPASIKEKIAVRGTVTANRFFQTTGTILCAALQGGKLRWLFHERGEFRREDDSVVTKGELDSRMRYRIQGSKTILGKNGQAVIIAPHQVPTRLSVDSVGLLPIFDANMQHTFWLQSGTLYRDGDIASEHIGDVLSGHTLFWVGPRFGFGFYRAGGLTVGFTFDAERKGLNDSVKIQPIRGQLVDATCTFSDTRCWFMLSTQEQGKLINRCVQISAQGIVEATAEAIEGDGSWLSSIRGACSAGSYLFSPTDDGIVRIEAEQGVLHVTKEFPDTEPFVDAHSQLFAGKDGLYVVGHQEITRLTIT
ncbi:MAG: hypothetical protein Q7R79_04745 [bacterium]|nr:hypothetical protein [bacterium]